MNARNNTPVTSAEIDELFRLTLVGDYEDEQDEGGPWEAVSRLQAIATREVFDHAARWARHEKPEKRRRGIDILAQLGRPVTEDESAAAGKVAFADESYAIVIDVLGSEKDEKVIDSCLVALGHFDNPSAVPVILGYAHSKDPDIRFAVTFALSCFANEPAAVEALIELSRDSDDDVRDWATFGLGLQSNADSPAVREALVARLADETEDTREEAVAGLGKRGDLRCLPDLIDLLHEDEVSYGVVEAASHLLGNESVNEEWPAEEYIQRLRRRFAKELAAHGFDEVS